MRTIWEDTARPEDLEALQPGRPDDLDREPDVLVVGGGVVGLATAAMCVRRGVGGVVVLEREDRLAAGVSASAAGGLSPDAHVGDPEPFVAFGRRSLELHRELDREWGTGLEDVDWFLIPSARSTDGVVVTGQSRVHPIRLAAAFARHSGTVATGVEVTGLEEGTVTTTLGDFRPRHAVFATGIAPSWLASEPQVEVKGHLVATGRAGFRIPTAVASPEALVLQLPDGELVAGGTLDHGDDSPDVRDEVVDRIVGEMHRLVPGSRGLEVAHRWCCFRPAVADRLPVIDLVAENAWVTCGHFRTGLLMAPAAGEAIAEWIATGERPDRVASFGLDRLRR